MIRRFDLTAVLALLLGGVVLPVVGWFAGAVMVLASRRWRWWEKLLGLLVIPGGLIVPTLMTVSSTRSGCAFFATHFSDVPQPSGSGSTFLVATCTEPGPLWHGYPLVLIPLVAAPVAVAVFLLVRSRRPRPQAASE